MELLAINLATRSPSSASISKVLVLTVERNASLVSAPVLLCTKAHGLSVPNLKTSVPSPVALAVRLPVIVAPLEVVSNFLLLSWYNSTAPFCTAENISSVLAAFLILS